MLRGEKVEEAKKADKDYDGDGKIESPKDEVWGSRFKAAKKAGKMEEGVDTSPIKKSTTSDPDFAAPSANPDAPKSPITFKANTATTVAKSTNEETSAEFAKRVVSSAAAQADKDKEETKKYTAKQDAYRKKLAGDVAAAKSKKTNEEFVDEAKKADKDYDGDEIGRAHV